MTKSFGVRYVIAKSYLLGVVLFARCLFQAVPGKLDYMTLATAHSLGSLLCCYTLSRAKAFGVNVQKTGLEFCPSDQAVRFLIPKRIIKLIDCRDKTEETCCNSFSTTYTACMTPVVCLTVV